MSERSEFMLKDWALRKADKELGKQFYNAFINLYQSQEKDLAIVETQKEQYRRISLNIV